MAWERLIMDGRTYRVRIVYDTRVRSFALTNGPAAGTMLSDRDERDLRGTKYDYQMAIEPDPKYPGDYDDLFDALSAPVATHRVTVPYGQGTMTYDAQIQNGSDVDHGVLSGVRQWGGLVVNYKAIRPQREAQP